ncbi:MAG: hypothetical protein RLZ63_877 [Pseudomonadota bacterium]|jgi:two-component system sensor histidine kinase DctS
MLWWMAGLLLMSLACMVALALYLKSFEKEEEQRQRQADIQWLQQSVRFHFQRLEEDLRAALQKRSAGATSLERGGLLWNTPGVLQHQFWIPATPPGKTVFPAPMQQAMAADPGNDNDLRIMLDIARGLRRINYAGPMRTQQQEPLDQVWMAIPLFEQGRHVGSYVVALSMGTALRALIPHWFSSEHALELIDQRHALKNATPLAPPAATYDAALELAGTDMAIRVQASPPLPPTVPRLFFATALLFLVGMVISLYALSRDIRKRRQVELQLRSQVALRTAMENSVSIGLRAWDTEGRILYVNRAFCTMVGYEPEALIGQSAPLPYWPAGQTDELQAIHAGLMRQGTQDMGVEVQFQHRDGHLIDTLIHEAPLTDAHGQQIGWMSSVLDISERKRTERVTRSQQEKLEALGRLVAVGEVASTLAHELNQPLGALSSFANGLLNRIRNRRIDLPEIEQVVSRMERLSDKAGRVIHRVNAFARRREMARERLAIAPFLQRLFKPYERMNQIQWTAHWPDSHLMVDADPGLLEHAFRNVLSNAVEWAMTQTRPRVHIDSVVLDQEVAIRIADSGPGVGDEHREQIFQAFYSAKEGGMGMGLAICRSVIEAHHGRLEVDRDPQLGGARISLWLPLSTQQDQS